MFAAAAAANISALQLNVDADGNSDTSKVRDEVPDAATRQAQVAATAAAFLKTMDEDELLQVVPEDPEEPVTYEPQLYDEYSRELNDSVNNLNQNNLQRLQSIEMNQIHDDLYRQLTGILWLNIKMLCASFIKF